MSGIILSDDAAPCPACGRAATMSEPCMLCPGEGNPECRGCGGTGQMRWCPGCGRDYRQALAVRDARAAAAAAARGQRLGGRS